jgi:putative glycosyltransferase (TIGR04372 family)
MVRRHLRINPVFRYLDTANQVIPGGKIHHKDACSTGGRDIKGYLARTNPHITFTSEEDIRGRHFLNKLGLVPSDRFVCLIVRDSAYKNKFQSTGTPFGDRDWSYHNYRDSDIDTYEDAAMGLAKKGYWVIRMGKVVHKPLKADHTRIIDYANTKFRSDFLDIWLMANCFFCISAGTGLDEVARIFRRPAVYVNYLPLQHLVTYDHVISVPKHLVWQETKKRLTLSEHLFHPFSESKQYEDAKIFVKDLTAEEICQAVLEKEARLTEKWQESNLDQQQQDRFWQIFKSYPDFRKYNGEIHPQACIGTHFLKNNPEWLN